MAAPSVFVVPPLDRPTQQRSPTIQRQEMERANTAKGANFVIGPLKRSSSETVGRTKLTSPRFASSCGSQILQQDYLAHRLQRLSTSGIDELPEELCSFQILLRCDVLTIGRLRQTCRVWNRKAGHQGLWEYKSYMHFGVTFFDLLDPSSFQTDWYQLFCQAFVAANRLAQPDVTFSSSTLVTLEEKIGDTFFQDGNRTVLLQDNKIQSFPFNSYSPITIPFSGKLDAVTIRPPFWVASTTVQNSFTIHFYHNEAKKLTSWDSPASSPCSRLSIHEDLIIGICGLDLYFWNLKGENLHRFSSNEPILKMLYVDRSSVLTMGPTQITFWSLKINKPTWKIPIVQPAVWSLSVGVDLQPSIRLFVSHGGMVKIFNLQKNALWNQIDDFPEDVTACFAYKDQAIVCLDNIIQVYSLKSPKPPILLHQISTNQTSIQWATILNNFLFFSDYSEVYRLDLSREEKESVPALLFKSPVRILQISVTLTRCLCALEDRSFIETKFF